MTLSVPAILDAVCQVMEVPSAQLSGCSTAVTPVRLQWARNMAALVAFNFGHNDAAAAAALGELSRVAILKRRRRMLAKLKVSKLYRDFHIAILARLVALYRQQQVS